MQARAFLLLLFGLVFSFGTFSQTITVLPLEGQFCSGATVHVPYSITGTFNIGNTFIVQLSDNNGSFSSPVNLGSQASVSSGTISVVVPAGLLFASQYKIRLVSTNPSASSTNVQPLIPENVDSNSWVRRRDFGGAPRAYAMTPIPTNGHKKGVLEALFVQQLLHSVLAVKDMRARATTAKIFGNMILKMTVGYPEHHTREVQESGLSLFR